MDSLLLFLGSSEDISLVGAVRFREQTWELAVSRFDSIGVTQVCYIEYRAIMNISFDFRERSPYIQKREIPGKDIA